MKRLTTIEWTITAGVVVLLAFGLAAALVGCKTVAPIKVEPKAEIDPNTVAGIANDLQMTRTEMHDMKVQGSVNASHNTNDVWTLRGLAAFVGLKALVGTVRWHQARNSGAKALKAIEILHAQATGGAHAAH